MEEGKSISEIFSNIDGYLYNYNERAKQLYDKSVGVDDNTHIGVMAQELAENPVTKTAVQEDENGYLEIDTKELIMTLTAVTADLAKRVEDIENEISYLLR